MSCGNTPLMGAAIKGHAAIVQLLIREKADVNHQNKVKDCFVFIKVLYTVIVHSA